jgi:Arc/MetJ family transcription regulator
VAAGAEAFEAAERMAALSDYAAATGERDVAEGLGMADVSEDLAAMGEAVRALSQEDVARGMELAAMSGQVGAVGDVVDAMGMGALSGFLGGVSARLKTIAVRDLVRWRGTTTLAQDLRRAGEQVAGMGATEVAEGLQALDAAGAIDDLGEAAARAGDELVTRGLGEAAGEAAAPPAGEARDGEPGPAA